MTKAMRFSVTLCLAAAVLLPLLWLMPQPFAKQLSFAPNNAHVSVYCHKTNLSSTNIGGGRIVSCKAQNLAKTLKQCQNVQGISVSFAASQCSLQNVLEYFSATTLSVLQIENVLVVCAFSPKVRGGIVVDGKRVNVQVACSGGVVTVGSPLILGSY